MERSRNLRRSITGRSVRNETACSASASSARPRSGSATAASSSPSGTRASFATGAASRLRTRRSAVSAWATSNSQAPCPTSGSTAPCPAAWAFCSTCPWRRSSRSSTTKNTSSSIRVRPSSKRCNFSPMKSTARPWTATAAHSPPAWAPKPSAPSSSRSTSTSSPRSSDRR
jgi:hypothetical protein